jgi:hypothetical protein
MAGTATRITEIDVCLDFGNCGGGTMIGPLLLRRYKPYDIKLPRHEHFQGLKSTFIACDNGFRGNGRWYVSGRGVLKSRNAQTIARNKMPSINIV